MLPPKETLEQEYHNLMRSRAWKQISNATKTLNVHMPIPPNHLSLKDLETILNILQPWEIDRLD